MFEKDLQIQNQVNSLSIIDSVEIGTIQSTLSKINQFQEVVKNTLKKDHDYGIIPGTAKPTLLKPGAEKILMLMGLTSEYEILEEIKDYEKGFFAYEVKCKLYKNGVKITEGFGHCNTKEKKYVNQDPFTLANTVLKMAKKRAQIDATLTIASLSEVFTQDLEDFQEYLQTEQIETMTPEEAGQIKLTFGKFKGKTLGEIYRLNKNYLEWLVTQDRTDPIIKKAINIMFEAVKNLSQAKQEVEPTQNTVEDTELVEDVSENIEVSEDELPFE